MGDVKLTDGGANTLTFSVDSYGEEDQDFDVSKRTTNATLKSYVVADKKFFVLGVRNITNTEYTTLKTIYDLKGSLEFYRIHDGAKTADVYWTGEFNLHTPTKRSHSLMSKLYQGTINLQEI